MAIDCFCFRRWGDLTALVNGKMSLRRIVLKMAIHTTDVLKNMTVPAAFTPAMEKQW